MAISKAQKIAVLVLITLALTFLACLPVFAGNLAIWSSMSSGTTKDINSGWGTKSRDVFAVGESGTILHYDGSIWSSMSTITTSDLYCVWGSGSSDIFAVGESGLILHYDGTIWSSMSTITTSDLYCVWGSDGSDVFTIGKSGTILHYDGSTWSSMSSGTAGDLYCVWGSDGSDVFAAGKSGVMVHYDGSIWSSMSSGTTGDLYGIWGSDSKNVFVVGESGTITYYDGSKFSSMNRNTTNDLRSVWGFSSMDVFTSGLAGTILRYMPPVINSISPHQGDQGEILDVTITGNNLGGASEVRFGTGIAVNSFTILNSTQISANITVVAGAGEGSRDVSVTTPGGSYTLPDSFTVKQALPTITSISPDQDRQAETLNVTISGTKLTGASEVRFGAGIAVNSIAVLSSNQVTVNITIAANAVAGSRDVSVTTPGGSVALPKSFSVKQALPTITSINPEQGNRETTMDVTISGTNLTGANELRFGTGVIVNRSTILSSNQIVANVSISAIAETGARDISVTTPGGSFSMPNSFTVKQSLPAITSISPDNGSQGATLNITVMGANLNGTSEVRIGTGIAVSSFTIINSNQIEAMITIVSGSEPGSRDVSVTTPGGSFSMPNGFVVKQGLPVIKSISPNQGSRGANLTVIISGSNLDGATSVSLGTGSEVQSFTNLSPTQLRVNVIIDAEAVTGLRDVSITTPGGSSTLGKSFTVKERSFGTLFLALIWVGIAIVSGLFIFILRILRKNRGSKV